MPKAYVYVIQGDGHFKVGKTTLRPRERMQSMQSANPTPLELVAWETVKHEELSAREAMAQEEFALSYPRGRGEWFVGTITPIEAFDRLEDHRPLMAAMAANPWNPGGTDA